MYIWEIATRRNSFINYKSNVSLAISVKNKSKMASQEEFDKAAENVKNLNSTPSDTDLLELYSLYKQATVGDCNTEKPGFLDFKGKAKWEAWNNRKGTTQDAARNSYVEKVKSLVEARGLKA